MSTVTPFDLDNQKGVNLSSCGLAKPNQLLSIIICLFLIKPEDLFDLVGFWECWGKHAANIMAQYGLFPMYTCHKPLMTKVYICHQNQNAKKYW
jgi:hypothetical protein